MKAETKFRTSVVDPFLRSLHNCVDFSIQQLSINGHPDKLICINGFFVALELKSENKEPRKLQHYYLHLVDVSGGVALYANQENWDDVKEILIYLDGIERSKHSLSNIGESQNENAGA